MALWVSIGNVCAVHGHGQCGPMRVRRTRRLLPAGRLCGNASTRCRTRRGLQGMGIDVERFLGDLPKVTATPGMVPASSASGQRRTGCQPPCSTTSPTPTGPSGTVWRFRRRAGTGQGQEQRRRQLLRADLPAELPCISSSQGPSSKDRRPPSCGRRWASRRRTRPAAR